MKSPVSLEAWRFLRDTKEELLNIGTIDEHQAQLVCFLAGQREFVRYSMSHSVTFDRQSLLFSMCVARERCQRGEIEEDWQKEWELLNSEAVLRMILGNHDFAR